MRRTLMAHQLTTSYYGFSDWLRNYPCASFLDALLPPPSILLRGQARPYPHNLSTAQATQGVAPLRRSLHVTRLTQRGRCLTPSTCDAPLVRLCRSHLDLRTRAYRPGPPSPPTVFPTRPLRASSASPTTYLLSKLTPITMLFLRLRILRHAISTMPSARSPHHQHSIREGRFSPYRRQLVSSERISGEAAAPDLRPTKCTLLQLKPMHAVVKVTRKEALYVVYVARWLIYLTLTYCPSSRDHSFSCRSYSRIVNPSYSSSTAPDFPLGPPSQLYMSHSLTHPADRAFTTLNDHFMLHRVHHPFAKTALPRAYFIPSQVAIIYSTHTRQREAPP